ncbi:MAG: trypsin-like peptidase domain-containing protein [Bacteroides sp.]|nr:MAG: trypsin-like peptidase domain-containing protein [Bacteroides sp.]
MKYNFIKKTFLYLLVTIIINIVVINIYSQINPNYTITPNSECIENDTINNVILAGNKDNNNLVSSYSNIDHMNNFTRSAALVTPAVVYIETIINNDDNKNNYSNIPFEDFFEDFFNKSSPMSSIKQKKEQKAGGSGVIISKDGYIVTNHHVINNASKIIITLENKQSIEAEIVGIDLSTDLALLKIDLDNLIYVKYGNSDNIRIGEWVLAIGNPFNLRSTVTAGIISATSRSLGILMASRDRSSAIESFIQTDAAINSGNSGGALVNIYGELIGINTAIVTKTGTYEGYGFAVPVNIVKKVVDDLLKYGIVQRGFIGIKFIEINSEFAKKKKISNIDGLYVDEVILNSGAFEAGIQSGDIITHFDGIKITGTGQLMSLVCLKHPGDTIKITLIRINKNIILPVVIKNSDNIAKIEKLPERFKLIGISIRALTNEEKQLYRTLNGVYVLSIAENSPLNRFTQITKGFIIIEVNNNKVNNSTSFLRSLDDNNGKYHLIKGFYPDQPGLYTFSFPLEN